MGSSIYKFGRKIRMKNLFLASKNKGKIEEYKKLLAVVNCKLLLQHINLSSERLKSMVKCLLDYSRLGKKVEIQAVDFNELLRDVLLGLNAKIKESDAKITISKLPKVKVQAPKLALIWQNLISNAIKYKATDNAPDLKIDYQEQPSYHRFSVRDNGIGFNMKYHDRIFEIFQRLHLS